MALRSRLFHRPQWRHVRRCVHTQNAWFSMSLPRFRAPGPGPKPKPRYEKGFLMRVAQSRKQPDPRHDSDWRNYFSKTAAQWKSGWQARYAKNRMPRLAMDGVMAFVFGTAFVYFFVLERVPITGRKRFSWLSQSTLTNLDETERIFRKMLQDNEEKLFIKSDYPGLRKIEAVLDRLVKVSGLDDTTWEIRVKDEPSRSSPVLYSSALQLAETHVSGSGSHSLLQN